MTTLAHCPPQTILGKQGALQNFFEEEKRSEVDSVLWLHSLHHHQGRGDVEYRMVSTGSHRTPLDRQLSEKIQICRFKGDILMNRKSEMGGAVVERERFKYRRWGAGGRS